MNNIYVDELPKKGACLNGCPYAVTDTWVSYCPFQQEENGDHLIVEENCVDTCPLKPLTERLAEERKKVVQEIDCELYTKMVVYGDAPSYTDIHSILNKIKENSV